MTEKQIKDLAKRVSVELMANGFMISICDMIVDRIISEQKKLDKEFQDNMTNMQTGTGFSGVFDFASFNSLDFGAHLFGPTDAGFIRDTN